MGDLFDNSPLKNVPRSGKGSSGNKGAIWSNTNPTTTNEDKDCLSSLFGILVVAVLFASPVLTAGLAAYRALVG